MSEPEGFDPDELPDSLAIDFDLNYDVNLAERNPFQISAVAQITKLVQKTLTIQIKVCKVKGRMRMRLSRTPSPYWYASFIDKLRMYIILVLFFSELLANTTR